MCPSFVHADELSSIGQTTAAVRSPSNGNIDQSSAGRMREQGDSVIYESGFRQIHLLSMDESSQDMLECKLERDVSWFERFGFGYLHNKSWFRRSGCHSALSDTHVEKKLHDHFSGTVGSLRCRRRLQRFEWPLVLFAALSCLLLRPTDATASWSKHDVEGGSAELMSSFEGRAAGGLYTLEAGGDVHSRSMWSECKESMTAAECIKSRETFMTLTLGANQRPFFNMSSDSLVVRWSSNQRLVIPNFVSNVAPGPSGQELDQNVTFSVSRSEGESFLAEEPAIALAYPFVIGSSAPLTLQTSSVRQGGSSHYTISLSDDGSQVSVDGVPLFDRVLFVAVVTAYAQMQVTMTTADQSFDQALYTSQLAGNLSVNEALVDMWYEASTPARRLHSSQYTVTVQVMATSWQQALQLASALPDAFPSTWSSVVILSNTTFMVDSSKNATSFLVSQSIVSASVADGSVSIPNFVHSLVGPDVEIDASGAPIAQFDVVALRHWLRNEQGTLGPAVAGSGTGSIFTTVPQISDVGTLTFEVAAGLGGEVEFAVSLTNYTRKFILRAFPINRPPQIQFAGGGTSANMLSNEIGAGHEGYLNFTVEVIDRGGFGTSSLRRLAWSSPPVVDAHPASLVSRVIFGRTCYALDVTTCSVTVQFSRYRFGVANVSIIATNPGSTVTSYGTDSMQITLSVEVESINDPPSFRLASHLLVISQNDGCAFVTLPSGSAMPLRCDRSTPLINNYDRFLYALSMGPYESQLPASCLDPDPTTCEDQTGVLAVSADNATAVSLIFSVAPDITNTGTLSFTLRPFMHGQTDFTVTLTDNGVPPLTTTQHFQLVVVQVNKPPSLIVDPIVSVCQGCVVSIQLVKGFSTGLQEPMGQQTLSFILEYDPTNAFFFLPNAMPTISSAGVLNFTLAPDVMGRIPFTLTARDSGGRDRGGWDMSERYLFSVVIRQANFPPTFTLPSPAVITVASGTGSVVLPLATSISAGPARETGQCGEISDTCQNQDVRFVTDYVDPPDMFVEAPWLDPSGTVHFTLAPNAQGSARVFIRLQDTGGTDPLTPVTNSSVVKQFVIAVTPPPRVPSFVLARNVSCLRATDVDMGCACPPSTDPQSSLDTCAPLSDPQGPAVVSVLEGSGETVISGFASQVSGAQGYLPNSISVFTMDSATGALTFQERRADPLIGGYGLENAVAAVASADGTYVYAAEHETDSLGIFMTTSKANSTTAGTWNMTLVDRLSDGSRRLTWAAKAPYGTIDSFGLSSLTSIPLPETDKAFTVVSTGARPLLEDALSRINPPPAPQLAVPAPQRDNLWARTTAYWQFDHKSVLAPVGVTQQQLRQRFTVQGLQDASRLRQSDFRCSAAGCSFLRNVTDVDWGACPQGRAVCPICTEKFATLIRRATVRDMTGKTGPLVMPGPACKSRVTVDDGISDWDVPTAQMDMLTFTMTHTDVGGAVQFDGVLNPGLYLAYSLDTLLPATANSATILPLSQLSFEIWFTIDAAPDSGVRRGLLGTESFFIDFAGAKGCARGWSLAYRHETSSTTLQLKVFAERRNAVSLQGVMEYSTPEPLAANVWQHVAATYNGSHIALFLNGVRTSTPQLACSSPPCGPILYPASYRASVLDDCFAGPHNLTVGALFNGMYVDDAKSGTVHRPHVGSIRSVRIYEVALTRAQVNASYSAAAQAFALSPLKPAVYYAVLENQTSVEARRSPTIDFAQVTATAQVSLLGAFDPLGEYACQWAPHDVSPPVGQLMPGAVSSDAQTLTCPTPRWEFGSSLSVLSVLQREAAVWRPLWMKVCISTACGFPVTRTGRLGWVFGTVDAVSGSATLRNNVHALPITFRFTSRSDIISLETAHSNTRGPVEDITIISGGSGYVDGELMIVSSLGQSFGATFSVNPASGAMVSFQIGSVGHAYSYAAGDRIIALHSSTRLRMDDTVTGISYVNASTGYIAGSFEVVGGTQIASGSFTVTSAFAIDKFTFFSNGIGYTGTVRSSDLRLYFVGTRVPQEGTIVAVRVVVSGVIGMSTSRLATAVCLANTPNCTGSGFEGTCVSVSGFLSRITISNHGSGYTPAFPPTIVCAGVDSAAMISIARVSAVIPARGNFNIRVATGASLSFTSASTPVQFVSSFGAPSSGLWALQRPHFGAASSTTHFETGGTNYLVVANHWDGATGASRTVATSAGMVEAAAEASMLYLLNPSTGAVSCVQRIPTVGAQRWHTFTMQGKLYLAVANYLSPLPAGSSSTSTTLTWSEIYTFNQSYTVSSATRPCEVDAIARTPEGPVNADAVTRFLTRGATAITTVEVFNKTKNGQVLLLVVANYFDSQLASFRTPSKVYMLGVKASSSTARFGARDEHFAKSCTDGSPCSLDADCHAGTCTVGCVVSRAGSGAVQRTCTCSNQNLACQSDAQCNINNVCEQRNVRVPAEPDASCWSGGGVAFSNRGVVSSSAPSGSVTMCEVQQLNTAAARDVHHFSVDDKDMLIFAQESDKDPSLLFLFNVTLQRFILVQSVNTYMANSVQPFFSPSVQTQFVVITSPNVTQVLRWNGTQLAGPLTPSTLSRDSASGQDIAYAGANAAAHVLHPANNKEYLHVGAGMPPGMSSLQGTMEVYVSEVIFGGSLHAPVAVLVSPDPSGSRVYVAARHHIGVYDRDPKTGLLTYMPDQSWSPPGDNGFVVPPAGHYQLFPEDPRRFFGYPLRGLSAAAMTSNGLNIYVANSYDNSLHVFERDSFTGQVTLSRTVENGPGMSMRGPAGISISPDDSLVVVAAAKEHSLALFARQDDNGDLVFIDSVLQGQRDVSSFFVHNNATRHTSGTYTNASIHIGAGMPWAYAASAFTSVVTTASNRRLAAVAASNATANTSGPAVVLEWNDVTRDFEVLQVISSDYVDGAVEVQLIEMDPTGQMPPGEALRVWLVAADAKGRISVHVWDDDSSTFSAHQMVSQMELPYDGEGCSCLCDEEDTRSACFDQGYISFDPSADNERNCSVLIAPAQTVSGIKYFTSPAGQHFLAVSIFRAHGGCTKDYSAVYLWNVDAPVHAVDGNVRWGYGFEPFQAIATHGARSVDFAAYSRPDGTLIELLMFACYADGGSGSSPILSLDSTAYNPLLRSNAGVFKPYLDIATVGGSAVRPVHIPGFADFIAVANSRRPAAVNETDQESMVVDVRQYDGHSMLLRWNGSTFELYQDLEHDQPLDATNSSSCNPLEGSLHGNINGSRLRGATDFTLVYSPDGEIYLAVAESLCDSHTAECSPDLVYDQPSSAVLQWDRVAGAFTEMLAMTDEACVRARGRRVQDEDMRIHQAALRVNAARVRRWAPFVGSAGDLMLVACSIQFGALVYRMQFDEFSGLRGVVDAVISANGNIVYAVSSEDGSVTAFAVKDRFDSLGNVVGKFAPLYDGVLPGGELKGVRGIWTGRVDCGGYTGADSNGTRYAPRQECMVLAVHGSAARDAMTCGPTLPLPATSLPGDVPPTCASIDFTTTLVDSTNPHLFEIPPHIISQGPERGSLHFKVRPLQLGVARFTVFISSNTSANATIGGALGGAVGATRRLAAAGSGAEFEVHVQNVNYAPTFDVQNVLVPEGSHGATYVFAFNIMAEGAGISAYQWEWGYSELGMAGTGCFTVYHNLTTCDGVNNSAASENPFFMQPPEFTFDTVNGTLVGNVSVYAVTRAYGNVTVYVRMHDGSVPNSRGGGVVSTARSFNITLVKINHAPSMQIKHIIPDRTEDDNNGLMTEPSMLISFDAGGVEDEGQTLVYSLYKMYSQVNPDLDLTRYVQQFSLDSSSRLLTMRFAPNFNGRVVVVVQAQDDGGTALGGVDKGYASFNLTIHPLNDVPSLLDNGSPSFVCRWSDASRSEDDLSTSTVALPNALRDATACAMISYFCGYIPQSINRAAWLQSPLMFEAKSTQSTVPWLLSAAPDSVPNFPAGLPSYVRMGPSGFMYMQRDAQNNVAGDFALLASPVLTSRLVDTWTSVGVGTSSTTRHTEYISRLTLSFWFLLWGAGAGTLSVEVRVLSNSAAQADSQGGWQTVWTRRGEMGQVWMQATADLGMALPSVVDGTGKSWQLRFKGVHGAGTQGVIAVADTMIGGTFIALDDVQNCRIEFDLEPSRFGAPTFVPNAFVVDQPEDEMLSQTLSFTVATQTSERIFSAPPLVFANGSALFFIAPNAEGLAEMTVTIKDSLFASSISYPFVVLVGRGSSPPSFVVDISILVVDSTGPFELPDFAVLDPEGAVQPVTFDIVYSTTTPGLFIEDPWVDANGTLRLQATPGYTGVADCSLGASHDEGQGQGAVRTLQRDRRLFQVRVRAQPQVLSVQPFFGGLGQKTTVTIRGRNFGSESSRGYSAPSYVVTAYVGSRAEQRWEKCLRSEYIGDEEMLCVAPPGSGPRDVKVEVIEDSVRAGVLQDGLLSVDSWIGGLIADDHCASVGAPWPHLQEAVSSCGVGGFVGAGPGPGGSSLVHLVRMNVSASVRAIVSNAGRLYVGGSFSVVDNIRVNSIFTSAGGAPEMMGLGLDGLVSALAVLDPAADKIIVGGSFTRVYLAAGSLRTGGIAMWDQQAGKWSTVGGVALQGVVLSLSVRGSQLFVGGRFGAVGDVQAANVAMFDGVLWHALGTGVVGEVYATAVTQHDDAYVGGSLQSAGGVNVQNVARWDGAQWTALVDQQCARTQSKQCGVDGVIYALATVGEYVYAAGSFTLAGGKPAHNVAVYYSGMWSSLGGGVEGGNVYAIGVVRAGMESCVFFGGDFKSVSDSRGVMTAKGLAKWCVGDPKKAVITTGSLDQLWSPMLVPEGVKQVRAIASFQT